MCLLHFTTWVQPPFLSSPLARIAVTSPLHQLIRTRGNSQPTTLYHFGRTSSVNFDTLKQVLHTPITFSHLLRKKFSRDSDLCTSYRRLKFRPTSQGGKDLSPTFYIFFQGISIIHQSLTAGPWKFWNAGKTKVKIKSTPIQERKTDMQKYVNNFSNLAFPSPPRP